MKEFDLIRRYFTPTDTPGDVSLGVGDDAALLCPPPGHELAVSVDTLVRGVHFPVDTPPEAIGHKALAVNLSDLAAMGATPRWVTLALTLDGEDAAWVEAFARGFLALARSHEVALVGGDTTRGPLSITVQAMGVVPAGTALRRSGARAGDAVLVTGSVGDAALALRELGQGALDPRLRARLDRPEPRVSAGRALRGLASACIDVSDGLAQDLGHVLTASGVGATLETARLPLSAAFREVQGDAVDWGLPLAGGDDYELLFTAPQAAVGPLCRTLAGLGCAASVIGRIETAPGLRILDPQGNPLSLQRGGYTHFDS